MNRRDGEPFRVGYEFIHDKWLTADPDRRPLRIRVTAVRHGVVYWRDAASAGRAQMYTDIEKTYGWRRA